MIESSKNEQETQNQEEISIKIESNKLSPKNSLEDPEQDNSIDVYAQLEDYLVQIASKTPQPSLEKLKEADPLTSNVSIQQLIQDFISRPDKSNETTLNLIKEIMR